MAGREVTDCVVQVIDCCVGLGVPAGSAKTFSDRVATVYGSGGQRPISRASHVAPPRLSMTTGYGGPGHIVWRVRQRARERARATMQAWEVQPAVAAAMSTASSLDLAADDAVVLHDSNRLTVRLLPCDVLARVAPVAHQVAQFEVELARRLAESGSPVAALDPRVEPRVYERDGLVVTLWTYYEPAAPREVSPADYANALGRSLTVNGLTATP